MTRNVKPKTLAESDIKESIDDIRARIHASLPLTGFEYLRPLFEREWQGLVERLEERDRGMVGDD